MSMLSTSALLDTINQVMAAMTAAGATSPEEFLPALGFEAAPWRTWMLDFENEYHLIIDDGHLHLPHTMQTARMRLVNEKLIPVQVFHPMQSAA